MTSAERLMRAASHREADRVPLLLATTMHGARALGLSLPEYFARPETVAEGWVRMQALTHTDAVLGMFYAALEHEAWGGTVRYFEDGPPTRVRRSCGARRRSAASSRRASTRAGGCRTCSMRFA